MDITEYIEDYTPEEWQALPINIRMRLYATGEYDFYKEDSIDAANEIERLQRVNVMQAKWLYEGEQKYKELLDKVRLYVKDEK